jgi:hypothetical protein
LGVTGFAVNWNGTGQPTQTPTDDADNQRLEWMFQSARRINAEGTPFHLILNYKGSANVLHPEVIANDLRYLTDLYAGEPTCSTTPTHH